MKNFILVLFLLLIGCIPKQAKFKFGDIVKINDGFFKGCVLKLYDYNENYYTYDGHVLSCSNTKVLDGYNMKYTPEYLLVQVPIISPIPTTSGKP